MTTFAVMVSASIDGLLLFSQIPHIRNTHMHHSVVTCYGVGTGYMVDEQSHPERNLYSFVSPPLSEPLVPRGQKITS